VELPWPCSNLEYEDRMRGACQRATAEEIAAVAFGDLFLQDIRDYRARQLQGTGLTPLFPVWQIPTVKLSRDMIAAGVKAKITCVDPSKLAKSFASHECDPQLLQALPLGIDPCGENGEFHVCVSRAGFLWPHRGADGRSDRARWICVCRLASANNRYLRKS
jgi:diphthamide synthase (EF-2-diphthine--ammonia ligase)